MKPKATKAFSLNGVFYEKGDEVEVKTKEELIRLNEKGFIEPLTIKQIQNIGGKKDGISQSTREHSED